MGAADKPRVKSKKAGVRSRKTAPPSSLGARKRDKPVDDMEKHVPQGLAGAFVNAKLHEKVVREAGLTPPQDFQGDMPELPDDVAASDYAELSQLMVDFQAALSTASWQASMYYIEADIMDEIAEHLENRALLASEQSNDKKRQAEAKTDDKVVYFRGRQKTAYHNYVRFRDLAKTIEGKVKVISRVGGFKDEDDNASDRTAKPKGKRRRG